MTDDTFDPYWQWLGIPPHERPVDHYRLLGLARFESDPQRIEAAADARMNLVRSFQSGPRVAHTQKLLNELSVARLCLINVQAKASYDAVLRGRQALSVAPAQYPANQTFPAAYPMVPPLATPAMAPPPYASAPVATFVRTASVGAAPMPTALPFPVALPHAAPVAPSVVAPPLPPPPPPPPPAPPPPAPPPPVAPPVMPPCASPASPAAGEVEEPVAEPRSLWASPWFMLTVVLALVGGAAGTWFLTRPKAPPSGDDIASAGDQADEAGSADGAATSSAAGANSKSTRSTIDDPFGPVEIIQEGTGEMHFSAQTAERAGDGLTLELRGDDQVIAGWSSAEQGLSWNFRIARPDVFRVELTYAATNEARGGRFAFQVDDDEAKVGEIAATGALDKFRTDIFHVPVHRNGSHRLYLTVHDLPDSGSIVFQTLRFVPKGIGDKKKP